MGSLFSTITGYFSKSLVWGTFLPVISFLLVFVLLTSPLLASGSQMFAPLATLEAQWQITLFTIITILLSGLLQILNVPIIQMYEGYPWRDTTVGRWSTRRLRNEYERRSARVAGMRTLLRAMEKAKLNPRLIASVNKQLRLIVSDPAPLAPGNRPWEIVWGDKIDPVLSGWEELFGRVKAVWDEQQQELFSSFPNSEGLILPTRLGNAIRSFEYYPAREYGMDAVTLWPRLLAKVDARYSEMIGDTKASFDFMINSSLLCTLMFAGLVSVGIISQRPFSSGGAFAAWVVEAAGFLWLAVWCYRKSIPQAVAWGETVKAAFDLYRRDLLEQLGYDRQIKSREEERRLWHNISVQMIYGDSPHGPLEPSYVADLPAPATKTYAAGKPEDIELEVTRAVEPQRFSDRLAVVIGVRNVDKGVRTARRVVITDTLPDGLEYVWGSAEVGGVDVIVEGTNPYRFKVGSIPPKEEIELSYKVFRREGRS